MYYSKLNKYLSYFFFAVIFTVFGYNLQVFTSEKSQSTLSLPSQELSCTYPINEAQTKVISHNINSRRINLPRNSYQQAALQFTVNNSDDNDLTAKLNSLFPAAEINEHIDNIRVFSNRLISELDTNDLDVHEDSLASISFSLTKKTPESITSSFDVSSKQVIYAHINVNGGLGTGNKQFFVKWRNIDTNEVLLFSPKRINPNSDDNWVSLIPENSWGDQNYEVSFYEFTSELNKLATEAYTTYTN